MKVNATEMHHILLSLSHYFYQMDTAAHIDRHFCDVSKDLELNMDGPAADTAHI